MIFFRGRAKMKEKKRASRRLGQVPQLWSRGFPTLPAGTERPRTQRLRLSASARRVPARGLSSSPEDAPRYSSFHPSSTSFHPLLPTPHRIARALQLLCCSSPLRRSVTEHRPEVPLPVAVAVAWPSK
jgi:hypothetical protein